MKITIEHSEAAFDLAAAQRIISQIKDKKDSVIGLSTGRTTGNMHRKVVQLHQEEPFDVSQTTFFGVDEVVGVPREYAGACYTMLRSELADGLGVDEDHLLMLPTQSDDYPAACREFQSAIQARGGIDLLILGLGENGHLGFNQPGTPFDSTAWVTRMDARLESRIRRETGLPGQHPLGGVTLGLADIMQARRILLVAKGDCKAAIVQKMLQGPVTTDVPASILQRHPDCEVLLDDDAASLIHGTENRQAAPEADRPSYLAPFLSMVFLFLVIGFLTTVNSQLQGPLQSAFLDRVGNLRNTLATMVTFSWFLAYPVCGGLGSRWIDRYGYKGTLLRGLGVMIAGLALFFLSSAYTVACPQSVLVLSGSSIPAGFFIFLLGSFVLGGAVTVLQVVINPYLMACHVRGTQPIQRLAIGGSANSVGTTIAPYFVSGIIFGGVALDQVQVSQLRLPFLAIALVILLVALSLRRLSLPDLAGTRAADAPLERSVWSFRHLALGVVAIFFYVGCEVCVGANINLYARSDLGLSTSTITLMATLYWGLMLVGRLCGSSLRSISPRTQLTFTTLMALLMLVLALAFNEPWLLVAVGLFHSIMWGAIFTLATNGLGRYTSAASGVFMTGVVGGAVLPLLQGAVADSLGAWRWSWLLVLFGELVMLSYALVGSRVREKDIKNIL